MDEIISLLPYSVIPPWTGPGGLALGSSSSKLVHSSRVICTTTITSPDSGTRPESCELHTRMLPWNHVTRVESGSRARSDVGRAIDWINFPFEVRVNASLYGGSSASARITVIEGSGTGTKIMSE